jgi:hydroxyethylthiazole kinase
MTRITGSGCSASAITGAFAAVSDSPFAAAAHAMAVIGIAGEMAAEISSGPGSFQMNLLDMLYNIKEADITERLKVRGL